MHICKDGWPFIAICTGMALACGAMGLAFRSVTFGVLASLAFIAAMFCAYFFRDPPRVIPQDPKLILSPADGKIMEIVEGRDGVSPTPVWILRIFLSVFDPHIQRSPVAGKVSTIVYKKGKFLDARDPKAAFENEQNRIVISAAPVGPVVVTQVAGLIARRILCWVREGQHLEMGQQIGLIRFGSQVDMVLPRNVQLRVKAGDRVEAGSSVIGELGA